jgi:hypothetical protein
MEGEEQGLAPNQVPNQETTDDSPASEKAYVIELPFKDRLCGVCLNAGNGSYLALSLNDEISHASMRHRNLDILFRCSKCNKAFKSKHGAQCHLPKCRGVEPETELHPHKCETCGRGFKTMRGVSQHERHEHPLVRNETMKAEAAQSAEPRKPKCFGQVWTKDEIESMLELETLLRGERFIAKKMCEFLPTKSNKQIRDKRAEATYSAQMKERLQSLETKTEEIEGLIEAPKPPSWRQQTTLKAKE